MSTQAHTPGPWAVWPNSPLYVRDGTPNGWGILSCHHRSSREAQANARLIAAAPDLLTSLTDLADAWDSEDGGRYRGNITKAHAAARAAIAKAEGRS